MKRAAALLLLVGAPALAQVEARQVSAEEAKAIAEQQAEDGIEMKSPMLLEVPFATKNGGSVFELFRLGSQVWRTEETAQYVCDRARVFGIEVTKEKAKKGRMKLRISTPVGTGWFRQDVNYTLALVAGGEAVGSQTWRDLTIGTPAGSLLWAGSDTKHQKLELDYTLDEWKAIEAKGDAVIRILLEISDD